MIDTDIDLTLMDIEYYKKELNKAKYMIARIDEDYDINNTNDIKESNLIRWVKEEKRLERILKLLDDNTYDWYINEKIRNKYIYSRPSHNQRLEFSVFEKSKFGFNEIYLRSEVFGIGNYDSDDDCMITDEDEKIEWQDVYRFRYVRY